MHEYRTDVNINGFKVYQPDKYDAVAAIKVSRWTRAAGTMLPKSPQEVLDMFSKGDSILVKDPSGHLLGHAAATAQYLDGAVEIGSIYTDKKSRGKGVGTIATQVVLEMQQKKNPNATLFALGNEMSGPMFTKMGGEEVSTDKLSQEVWEPCATCPRKPEQKGDVFMCCDTPYDLTNVVKGQADK